MNNKLTNQSSVRLSWTNNQGITFEKEISLDDKFLFTIKQRVINSTEKAYNGFKQVYDHIKEHNAFDIQLTDKFEQLNFSFNR